MRKSMDRTGAVVPGPGEQVDQRHRKMGRRLKIVMAAGIVDQAQKDRPCLRTARERHLACAFSPAYAQVYECVVGLVRAPVFQ